MVPAIIVIPGGTLQRKTIAEVLDMTVTEACEFLKICHVFIVSLRFLKMLV